MQRPRFQIDVLITGEVQKNYMHEFLLRWLYIQTSESSVRESYTLFRGEQRFVNTANLSFTHQLTVHTPSPWTNTGKSEGKL